MLPPKLIEEAREFVRILKSQPELLHVPDLKFLRDYLESLGATIPPPKKTQAQESPKKTVEKPEVVEESEPESEESEVELDMTGVIEEESDEPQPMGDESVEVTEEMEAKASEKRCEAQAKFSEKKYQDAADLFTESIIADPRRAVTFAKRAACYYELKKPKAAIRDCDQAIKLNPDSAAAYKWRGLAKKSLGQFEGAYYDLTNALKIDYDEAANEALKSVTPNFKRIHEHKLKWDRKREERKYKELKKQREARQRAYEEAKKTEVPNFPAEEGEMPPGMQDIFGKLFSDPELMAAMQDPELQEAFSKGMSDPTAFAAAAKNPKFAKFMKKMQEKMGFPEEAGDIPQPPTTGGNVPHSKPPGDDDLD